MIRKVEFVPHNPDWYSLFETELQQNVHIEDDALTYSSLKRSLWSKYPNDIKGYMDGKHDFIQEIDRKAAQWRM
jgi:GrpB-like predicted nucleotidyltransferase (UPF0157 family)